MNNADFPYRPLLGGVGLFNARIVEPGTLGYFGRDLTGTWLISAYHVLCNSNFAPMTAGETICQPTADVLTNRVATTSISKADSLLDCAAAQLAPAITCINAQLGLGPVTAPKAPAVGMRVAKSGFATGVTEGIITQISGDTIRIEANPVFDPSYVLSAAGDSGSLWVEQDTRAPIALHRGHSTPRRADALNIVTALAALGLVAL